MQKRFHTKKSTKDHIVHVHSIDTSDLEGKEHPTLVLCNSQPLTKRAPLAFAAAAASGQGGNGTAILEEYVSKVVSSGQKNGFFLKKNMSVKI